MDVTLALIERNYLGFQVRYDDVRIAFTSRFPYGIHFIVENNEIIVIGIYHASRNPERWIERRKKF